jgi:hypothetical protein
MRNIYIALLTVLTTSLFTNAQQLVLTPQVGYQNSKTRTLFNNSPYYVPGSDNTAMLGLRLNYQSKKGHGPYISAGLVSTTSNYDLMDLGIGYHSLLGITTDAFRVQAGYQWNSKPLYFKRIWDNRMSPAEFAAQKKKGWSVRFQPYIGAGIDFRRGNDGNDIAQINNTSIVTYSNRRNFHIASGINLEFGRNDKKKFTLGIGYVQSIGSCSQNSTYIQNSGSGNIYQTQLCGRTSGFHVTLGIPLTLWKKQR